MTTVLIVLIWLVSLALVYMVVPELLNHYLGWGARRQGHLGGRVAALTFDDGPGASTAAILDLLARHHVRATFFMLAEEADRRPDLAQQVHEAGHEVANHGAHHRPAWLMGPVATFHAIDDGAAHLAAVTGERPHLYRPPWGQFNAFTVLAARRSGQEIMLWNVNPLDWARRTTPHALARRIIAGADRGNVILLHDAGGDGRTRTVAALEEALPVLESRGVRLVPVSELIASEDGRRSSLVSIWNVWEALFDRLFKVDDLGEDALFRLSRVAYKGRDIPLEGGRTLKRGDIYGEIHFKNDRLGRLGPIRGLRAFRGSMKSLATYVEENEKYRDVDLFVGTTILARPAEALGFHSVRTLPGIGEWWAKVYRNWLITVYHPAGSQRLKAGADKLELRLAYITREELQRRYGPQDEAPAEGGRSDPPEEG